MRHLLAATALCLTASVSSVASAQPLDYDATLAAAARQERDGHPAAALLRQGQVLHVRGVRHVLDRQRGALTRLTF